MRAQYVLECLARGVHARICVNDVPVFHHQGGGSTGSIVQINPWLVDEPTELCIDVAGARQDGALSGELAISLVARMEGEVERELCEIILPRDARDVVTSGAEWRVQHIARVAGLAHPPSEFWPAARPLILRDEDRAAIHELVLGCQRALDVMDVGELEQALSFQLADTARAYHVSELGMRAALALALDGAVGSEEIDPDADEGIEHLGSSMQLHLIARDRLVWVTRDAYADALRVPAMQPRMTMPVYMAPLDGRWTIVR